MIHSAPPVSGDLISALELTALRAPAAGIGIYDRRGQRCDCKTYAELLESAKACSGKLAAAGIGAQDRLLLCLPTSWELLSVFLGALIRGAYPVLVAPSGPLGGAPSHAHKLDALTEMLGAKRLFCDAPTQRLLAEFNARSACAASLTPHALADLHPVSDARAARPDPDGIAFLQLTSGSTGRQRAVMIRHSNALHNASAMADFSGIRAFESSRSLASWLPLNHDMGLIGCLILPLTHGLNLSLLRPETFLARPRLWLEALSTHSNVLSPAPNFAYQLCVERIGEAEVAGLKLDGWQSAMTGAEMIHPETCRAFSERFRAAGFSPESFRPCYGMAEGTLAITCDRQRQGVRTRTVPSHTPDSAPQEFVCTGAPVKDTAVRICAPGGGNDPLPEGQIGEICASGPGVFAGYYNDETATREALRDGWLRTGDLGFLHSGELCVTGRIKDLLIIHGHNLMPHELEWLAEEVCGGGGSERCGAFSVAQGTAGEQAVLVMEVSGKDAAALSGLNHEIRSRIGRALGLPLADMVFVKRGQIPKTTSGKVQRRQLKERYLAGQLERLV